MLVNAMNNTKQGRQGHFGGFTDHTLSDWYLYPLEGGERESYVCDQLEIPSLTVETCIIRKNRGTHTHTLHLQHMKQANVYILVDVLINVHSHAHMSCILC